MFYGNRLREKKLKKGCGDVVCLPTSREYKDHLPEKVVPSRQLVRRQVISPCLLSFEASSDPETTFSQMLEQCFYLTCSVLTVAATVRKAKH